MRLDDGRTEAGSLALQLEAARLDVAERERRERKARAEAERLRREDLARAQRIKAGELAQARARVALSGLIASGPVTTAAQARQRLQLAGDAGLLPYAWMLASARLEVTPRGVVARFDRAEQPGLAKMLSARDPLILSAEQRAADALGWPLVVVPC